jgi:hypothetical protein
MRTLPGVFVSAIVASMVFVRVAAAQPAPPDVTDGEFKCMARTSKAEAKFWTSKLKCVSRCFAGFWDGVFPESDCLPPSYGGASATCIVDSVLHAKGAEDKFALEIRKRCDPTFKLGTECPGCYAGGDCSAAGFASQQVANFENQVDSFIPGVFCERTGAFILEQRCQRTTAKWLGKYMTYAGKCYDKCYRNARRGLVPFGDCAPPASDVPTAECLLVAEIKTAYYIDHDCHAPPSVPDNCGGPYPTADEWVNLFRIVASGNVPPTYCSN